MCKVIVISYRSKGNVFKRFHSQTINFIVLFFQRRKLLFKGNFSRDFHVASNWYLLPVMTIPIRNHVTWAWKISKNRFSLSEAIKFGWKEIRVVEIFLVSTFALLKYHNDRLKPNLSISVTVYKTFYLICKYSIKWTRRKTAPSNTWCHLRTME